MKVIFITGASSGIGRSTARLLLAQGNMVYCATRRLERMTKLEEAVAKVAGLDVTDEISSVIPVAYGQASSIETINRYYPKILSKINT